ncbi:hypothetical protein Mapa_002817 [Marchantia paleacea]|nr:hypothetical protein Mapa_002817 [Marchantia paleacea]
MTNPIGNKCNMYKTNKSATLLDPQLFNIITLVRERDSRVGTKNWKRFSMESTFEIFRIWVSISLLPNLDIRWSIVLERRYQTK